jgi:putative transposase
MTYTTFRTFTNGGFFQNKERPTNDEKSMGLQIGEARFRDHLGEMVRGTVEEALNALLKMPKPISFVARPRAQRSPTGYESGQLRRTLHTRAGDVNVKLPKLTSQTFETAINERYRRRESSVEEALIEMYLAGISVRRIEDITEALWGTRVGPVQCPTSDRRWASLSLSGRDCDEADWAGEVRNVSPSGLAKTLGINGAGH